MSQRRMLMWNRIDCVKPPADVSILIVYRDGFGESQIAIARYSRWGVLEIDGMDAAMLPHKLEITHWMHLPKAPKADEHHHHQQR